jgi:enoyl-CoA hydratase
MNQELVRIERLAGITIVTLNRPEALNAMSTALRNQISSTFDELSNDDETEVIILTGAGKAFTVGLDLKELGGEKAKSEGASSRDLETAIREFKKPIIGAINGFAITGGFDLALMCDFLIASTNAKFADTHARVGVVPGWGLSQKLPRLVGINRAKELSLTGNFLNAKKAEDWGLVNRVVKEADLIPTCISLAQDILSTDRATRDEIRRIMDAGWLSTLYEGLDWEKQANRSHSKKHKPSQAVASRRKSIQARGRDQSNN